MHLNTRGLIVASALFLLIDTPAIALPIAKNVDIKIPGLGGVKVNSTSIAKTSVSVTATSLSKATSTSTMKTTETMRPVGKGKPEVDDEDEREDETEIEDDETEEDDTETDETEVDDTEVDETETDDTEVDETGTDDTEVDETEVDDAEVDEADADETEVDETETDEVEDSDEVDETETDETETDEVETDETDETETDETDETDETETDETETDETETDTPTKKPKPADDDEDKPTKKQKPADDDEDTPKKTPKGCSKEEVDMNSKAAPAKKPFQPKLKPKVEFKGDEVIVKLPASITYTEVYHWDNRCSNQLFEYEKEVEVTENVVKEEFKSYAMEQVKTQAKSSSVGVSVGASFSFLSASVDTTFTESSEVQDFVSQAGSSSTKIDRTDRQREVTKIIVGPGEDLRLYQPVFTGPGMDKRFRSTTNSPKPDQEFYVVIKLQKNELKMLKGFKAKVVNQEHEKPNGIVREASNQGENINKDFKGKFVYLEPEYTDKPDDACTSFEVDVFSREDGVPSNYDPEGFAVQIGQDAEEKSWRFLRCRKDKSEKAKIQPDVALLRTTSSTEANKAFPQGKYKNLSKNLNEGRNNKDSNFLYLAYNTATMSDKIGGNAWPLPK